MPKQNTRTHRKKGSREQKPYKLKVKYLENTGSASGSAEHEVPLRTFYMDSLERCYKMVNETHAGKIAWAAIYRNTSAYGPLFAKFTLHKGWNHQV